DGRSVAARLVGWPGEDSGAFARTEHRLAEPDVPARHRWGLDHGGEVAGAVRGRRAGPSRAVGRRRVESLDARVYLSARSPKLVDALRAEGLVAEVVG